MRFRRIWETRPEEPAADARKAEGASCTALWISSPLNFTGSEAWVHAQPESPSGTLAILLVVDFRKSSYVHAQLLGYETWGSQQGVEELWDDERVTEEGGILSMEVGEPVFHGS